MTTADIRAYKRKWAAANRLIPGVKERERQNAQKHYAKHGDRRRAAARAWKAKNKDRIRAYRRRYFQEHRDQEKANLQRFLHKNPNFKGQADKRYRTRHAARIKVHHRSPAYKHKKNAAQRLRYATDVQYVIGKRLRASLIQALRKAGVRKTTRTFALIGCSPQDLKRHLESKFKPGMSWDRRHEIEIDHILPVASFDLTDPQQVQRCFHYTNLQPLWTAENREKRDKIITAAAA